MLITCHLCAKCPIKRVRLKKPITMKTAFSISRILHGLMFTAAGLQMSRYVPLALTALPLRALFAQSSGARS
jgi:hypothetical protein